MEKISFDKFQILNYVQFKLDKEDNLFNLDELKSITEIVIDCTEEPLLSYIKDISKLKYLSSITIRNTYINNISFEVLSNLNYLTNITFEKCDFENADLIATLNLLSLTIVDCNINNYNFINLLTNLKELSIINANIKLNEINSKLEYLQLSNSKVNENIILIPTIKELYIDNTNIINLNILNDLPNLEHLSIDEKQYKNNTQLINELKKKITVLNENMTSFEDVEDEL